MNSKIIKEQKDFFDIFKNQYNPRLINNPPLHTKLELELTLNKLKAHGISGLIADYGSGSGRLTIPLLRNDFSVWAIDLSKNSLITLKKIAETLPNKSLYTATKFPKNIQFDAIVGSDILHHVNLDECLETLYTSLKKNGRIIFSEPGAFNLSWYVYLPLSRNWNIEKGVITCSLNNLTKKLTYHNFKNIHITGFGLLPRPFLNFSVAACKLNDALGHVGILKYFAYRYIVEAQK